MTITTHFVRAGGRAVHYRHRGRGAPVVLLHASPRSSESLEPLMRAAPAGLSVFAPDTPGFGRSDRLSGDKPAIEDFADALADTLTALGIARTALYGTHTGADIALVFAVRHPARVARLVLDGLSCFDVTERADLVAHYLPPFEPTRDGAHMAWLWSRVRDQALFFPWHRRTTATRLWRPMPDVDGLHRAAVDWLVASDPRSAYVASIEADSTAWLARLRMPALVGAREGDVLEAHLPRLQRAPPQITIERFAGDRSAWSSRIWQALAESTLVGVDAVAVDTSLASTVVVDTMSGIPGRRIRWRGRISGTLRPTVWIHDSPGSICTLDAAALTTRHDGPVLALDLPGHGGSDPPADADPSTLVDAVDAALNALGLVDAGLAGAGSGAALADALGRRRPTRWHPALIGKPRGPTAPPPFVAPREDGGHLFAAWQRARDDAILGPWWSRDPLVRHDFGDTLDWFAIQRSAVAQLVEDQRAARWRTSIANPPSRL